jgi:ribosomal protein L37AE/L43A
MSFDDIPEDNEESYPCVNCGGSITQNIDGDWECNTCDVKFSMEKEVNDD